MFRFIIGTLFGVYLEQNYNLPNIQDKLIELDEYLKKNSKNK